MRVARLFLFVAVMGSVFSSGALAQVTIGIDGASLRVGEVVEIPIEINSVDGLDITSYQFTLLFPEDVLDIVGVETAGTLSEGKSVIVNTDTEGEIRVAMAGTNALSGSGSLLILSGIVTGDDLFGER
ncbi:MAG: cohesin domain-containing protein, partial [Rhodothermaceae bacterium]|nr:cohesin domain-containing protein [Rhodothermaceae bacterium]